MEPGAGNGDSFGAIALGPPLGTMLAMVLFTRTAWLVLHILRPHLLTPDCVTEKQITIYPSCPEDGLSR